MSDNFNKNRIFKNTILLYVRMLFTMWLNLYTTRLVLKNLGVEDMGVYGVVGSIVSIFSVFTGGITTSIQRFITFELGLGDRGNVARVFSTSMTLLLIFGGVLFLLLETGGIYALYHWVKIPAGSMDAAFWVFQFSIMSCIVSILAVPYNALVIAHERMSAFAVISIIQVVVTCISAYCLSLFASMRLMWYSLFMTLIGVGVVVMYVVYCRRHFSDHCRYTPSLDREGLRSIGKYAGVSTLSGIFNMITSQGITLVINWTFGVALNAVYNIALQLKNSVLSFAFNLFKAIQPQITKTYAEGNIETHKKLVFSGAKIEAYLIFFIMVPFMFRSEYILHLWLGQLPAYIVPFCQCTILLSLTYAVFEPIRTSVLATANITRFMIIPEAFQTLTLPVAYGVAWLSKSPVMMIISIIAMDLLTCALRLWYGRQVCPIHIRETISRVGVPVALVLTLSSITCYGITFITSENITGLFLLLVLNSLALVVIITLVGVNASERNTLRLAYAKVRGKLS